MRQIIHRSELQDILRRTDEPYLVITVDSQWALSIETLQERLVLNRVKPEVQAVENSFEKVTD